MSDSAPAATQAPEPEPEPADPGPPEPQGDLPRHYDHIVRIGVEVEPARVPGFLALVRSRPWPFVDLGEGRYDVHVPLSGSALGATTAAMLEFRQACDRSGVHARLLFAARSRPRAAPHRWYPVMLPTRLPSREWLAAPARRLLWWRRRGYIEARNRAEAETLLPGFIERNPDAGEEGEELVVSGPADPADLPPDAAPPSPGTLVVGVFFVLVGLAGLAALLLVFRPPGMQNWHLVVMPLVLVCLFGLWRVVLRIPEGRVDTWFPLALTLLVVPGTAALASWNQDAYLAPFGVSAGEVTVSGAGRLSAVVSSLPVMVVSLVIALGAFGLLRHFHLEPRRMRGFQVLIIAGTALVYTFTVVLVLTERNTETAQQHIALYREEGAAPVEYVGIRPTAVCVEETGDAPVNRIGPPLTTDRPVLYFAGANNVDLLWDREQGTTRVTRFSVTLTPVSSLADACPPAS